MLQPTAAILAAAASAGLIVAFVPGGKPNTGTVQAAIDQNLSDPSRADTLAVESISSATTLRAASAQDLQNSSVDHITACVQSWPYYEPSCLRSSNPSTPRTIRVVGDRSAAAHAERARR